MATMTANTSPTGGPTHYPSDLVNRAESSLELTKRFAHMQLKSVPCTPKRQPTIVCEDIADDVVDQELLEQDQGAQQQQESAKAQNLLLRSGSSASLSVPVICENELVEKRRPPLPQRIDLDH